MARIVVIGGGIAGLTTALLLGTRRPPRHGARARPGGARRAGGRVHDVGAARRAAVPPAPRLRPPRLRAPRRRAARRQRRARRRRRHPHQPHRRPARRDDGRVPSDRPPLRPGDRPPGDGRGDARRGRGGRGRARRAARRSRARRSSPARARPAGVPHVTGVALATGERVPADLVVDCSGRRSAVPALLESIGATRPVAERGDDGFVYYCRHFRGAGAPGAARPAAAAVRLGLVRDDPRRQRHVVGRPDGRDGGPLDAARHGSARRGPGSSAATRCSPTGSTASRSPTCRSWPARPTA